jgi:ubiquinone/menaquinone biosynthesis C-methylase UbiE
MDDPREAMRLELKVDPEEWVHKYIAHRIQPHSSVLDVGCGPGVILREIAELDPTIRATGLEVSPDRVRIAVDKHTDNSRITFAAGDAHAMQFASDSFDFVYSRMLFQYLPEKQRALAELVRVCRRGGTVLLQDLDGQLLWHFPEIPAVQRAVETVVKALSKTGFDPFVGRKLFRFAQLAGLENIKVDIECYHLIAGEARPQILEQWKLKLEIAFPHIAEVLGQQGARRQIDSFLEYLQRPDTLTYSTVFTVVGEKPL